MTDLIVKNACVVTMNPERVIYKNGAIAIDGNNISGVGPTTEILDAHEAAQIIDASGMLATPGLIDAHQHPAQYLSNGVGDDVDLTTWLYERVYPYETTLTPEEAYTGALGAYAESIKYGTTCFNDPGGHNADSSARAAIDIGIRGIIGRSTQDHNDPVFHAPPALIEDTETCLANCEAHVSRWHGEAAGRLRAGYSLRYIFNVSDELCRGLKTLADRDGVGLHAHAAETPEENPSALEKFGKRSLARYRDLGLFDPNLYLIHMGHVTEEEIRWLVEHDVKVAHCPNASMFLGLGNFSTRMFPKMIEAGVTISLGTDSASAGGHLDMVRVMGLAAYGHRDIAGSPELVGAHKALEMATIDAARACLWEDGVGSLEVGKLADLALFDCNTIEHHPGRDPVSNLVYSFTGRNAHTVIIDGQVVMRDRELLTVDEPKLKRSLTDASAAWRERAGVNLPERWPQR